MRQSKQRSQAPWKEALLADVTAMEGHEFAFSSIHRDHEDNEAASTPRARFCVFRCFWAELPRKSNNPAERNSDLFQSELPVFTTDVRTSKIRDIFGNDQDCQPSGGGGECEAVWWARGSLTQWRIRGQAFVVAPDINTDANGAEFVRRSLRSRMHEIEAKTSSPWSWERELTAIFGDLSPSKRGRYVAPPPGQPIDAPYDHEKFGVGREVHDLYHPVARENFRAVVIVPQEVEALEMRNPETARRHLYTFNKDTEEWMYQECWP